MADSEPTGDEIPLAGAEVKADGDKPETESPVSEGGADDAPGEDSKVEGGCSGWCFCRAIIFIITAPIMLVLMLLSLVLWIILLPLKCLCPCIAPCLQCLVDAVVWMVKLPIRFLRWVAGKTEEDKPEEKTAVTAEEGKVNYGSTKTEGEALKDESTKGDTVKEESKTGDTVKDEPTTGDTVKDEPTTGEANKTAEENKEG